VPDSAVLVEPEARNTGENIDFTRRLLADHDVKVASVLLVSRPYQQRRAYATATMRWPEVEVTGAGSPPPNTSPPRCKLPAGASSTPATPRGSSDPLSS
jgi:uncharacterized SAM-binding protein YcdF (DUF218 family)